MFKHKTVRKIANYTSVLYTLNIGQPLLSYSYAQTNTQEAQEKTLKRQSAQYNLGDDMAESITLPETLQGLTEIKFLNDENTKNTINDQYTNLINNKGKSEAEALRIIVYATLESILNHTSGKQRYYVTKSELEHAVESNQSVSQKELTEKFDKFGDNYGDNYGKDEAIIRMEILKKYAIGNGLILKETQEAQERSITKEDVENVVKDSKTKFDKAADHVYNLLLLLPENISNPEDFEFLESELNKIIKELENSYETNIQDNEKYRVYESIIEKVSKLVLEKLEKEEKLESIKLFLNLFDNSDKEAIKLMLSSNNINSVIDRYKKTLKQFIEFESALNIWYLGLNKENTFSFEALQVEAFENLPLIYQENINIALQDWASEMSEEEFINTLNEILKKITNEEGNTFRNIINGVVYTFYGAGNPIENASEWESFIVDLYNQQVDDDTFQNRTSFLFDSINETQTYLNNYNTYSTIQSNLTLLEEYTEEEVLEMFSTLKIDEASLNLILEGYYGPNCELLSEYSNPKSSNIDTYASAITKLIQNKEENQKLWNNFYGARPYEANLMLFYSNDIEFDTGDVIRRNRFNVFGMLEFSKLFDNSEIFQNCKAEELQMIISYSRNLPIHYEIILFENPTLLEQIITNLNDENDQNRVFQTMFGHLNSIYTSSDKKDRIENMKDYLEADLNKIAKMLDELKSKYITTGNTIQVRKPQERLGIETIPDLYSQISGINQLLADYDIPQGYIHNFNQAQKFLSSSLTIYFPDPYWRERNLQYSAGKDRIISSLTEKYTEIMSKTRKTNFNRYAGNLFGHHEAEYVDIEAALGMTGQNREKFETIIKRYLGRGFGSEGVLNENINNNLSMNLGNMRALGAYWLNGILEFSENQYNEGNPLQLQRYNNVSNLDLNGIAGGGNLIIMSNTKRDLINGTMDELDAQRIADNYNFDILYSSGGNWYKIVFNREQEKQFIETMTSTGYKQHMFIEMMKNLGTVDLNLGVEEIKTGAERNITDGRYGGFLVGTIPMNNEETLKTGTLVARTVSEDLGGAIALESTGKNNLLNKLFKGDTVLISLGFFTYSNSDLTYYNSERGQKLADMSPGEQVGSFELLVVDKVRTLLYLTKGQSGSIDGGAAIYTKNLNSSILYQYDDSRREANIFTSLGYYHKNIQGLGYYKHLIGQEPEAGAISQWTINENLTLSAFAKIKGETIFFGNNPAMVKQFGDISQAIDVIAQDIQNNLVGIQNDEAFKNTKLKQWNTQIWQIMSSFRRWQPNILGDNPINFGIVLTDLKKGMSMKLTLNGIDHIDPNTGEVDQVIYTTGIFTKNWENGKEFTLLAGTNVTKTNVDSLTKNELTNIVGAKFSNLKLTFNLWGTNVGKTDIENVERAWGSGLEYDMTGTKLDPGTSLGLRLNVMEENGWILEGRVGDKSRGLLFDYGKINNMETKAFGVRYYILDKFMMEGMYTFAETPGNMENNWAKRSEFDISATWRNENGFGITGTFNQNTIKTSEGSYPVWEFRLNFSGNF
ncbi:hypothetical protein KO317_03455 [Candidatus Micrarchaeota archaeon]|nr:hypothetical protein [Candidatus Micrarchaeota archaeon]